MKLHFGTIICALSLIACQENVEELPVPELVETTYEQVEWKSFIGQDWLIDDQHSYVGFKIKYFGFSPVRGRFDSFDGTLFYNSDYLSQLSVRVSIPVTSINTGQERRDQDLINEESWFNGIEHPFLDFESKEVIIRGDGRFDLVGELQMNGIRLIDTIAFAKPTPITKDWAGNDQVDFSGKLTLNRQDYKVRGGDFWSTIMENGLTQLSDLVEIELDMHCRRADYNIRYADALEDDLDKVLLDQIDTEGIDETLRRMAMLFSYQELSSGVMNTVGNTLNVRGKHEEALAVFRKKQEFFPLKHTTLNQLGITYLLLDRREEASRCFKDLLEEQPTNSRAMQYQSLINQMALD